MTRAKKKATLAQSKPKAKSARVPKNILLACGARIAKCDSCHEVSEGWSTTVAGSAEFYCDVCWSEYDATVSKRAREYDGRLWHDEIILAEEEGASRGHGGKVLEFLESALSAAETQPVAPLVLPDRSTCDTDENERTTSHSHDDLEEDRDKFMPLPEDTARAKDLKPARDKECESEHIVVLVDRSGSMRTTDVEKDEECITRMDAVLQSLQSFFDNQLTMGSKNVFSLVSFNSAGFIHFAKKTAKQARNQLKFGSFPHACEGTLFQVGFRTVGEVLQKNPQGRRPHLLIFSDGRPADAASMMDEASKLMNEFELMRVHAIGFGDSLSSFDYLQQLTAIGGGTFVPSRLSMNGLRHAFSSVSSTITDTQTSGSAFSFRDGGREQKTLKGVAASERKRLRIVTFEPAGQFYFGENRSQTIKCKRFFFTFNGRTFRRRKGFRDDQAYDVFLRLRPFTQGGMRLVYCLQDKTVPRWADHQASVEAGTDARMVAKLSKYEDVWHNSEEVVAGFAKSSAVAIFNARAFTMACASSLGPNGRAVARIVFVECYLYEAIESANTLAPYMIGERYLPGTFLKYNSNKGYVNRNAPDSEVAQAFSHFTYKVSGGKMIVLDLQGVHLDSSYRRRPHLIFTDSQVVSLDRSFGPGDLGAVGIAAFFQTHRCGRTCKALGLDTAIPRVLTCSSAESSGTLPARSSSSCPDSATTLDLNLAAPPGLSAPPRSLSPMQEQLPKMSSQLRHLDPPLSLNKRVSEGAARVDSPRSAELKRIMAAHCVAREAAHCVAKKLHDDGRITPPVFNCPDTVVRSIRPLKTKGNAIVTFSSNEAAAMICENFRNIEINGISVSVVPGRGDASTVFISGFKNLTMQELHERFVHEHAKLSDNLFDSPLQEASSCMTTSMSDNGSSSLLTNELTMYDGTMFKTEAALVHAERGSPSRQPAASTTFSSGSTTSSDIHESLPDEREDPVPSTIRSEALADVSKSFNAIVYGPGGRKIRIQDIDDNGLSRAITSEFNIPDIEQYLFHEPPDPNGTRFYRVERKMDARRLSFTQENISPIFRDGRPVYELLNQLNSGEVDPLRELEPLDVVWAEGKWMSLSNRRLWALKLSTTAVSGNSVWVRVNVKSIDDEFYRKYKTRNGGVSVRISRSRSTSPVPS